MRFSIVLLVGSLAAATASAQLPEPLSSALTQATDTPTYVFDIERTSTSTGDDGETLSAYARVDLNAPELKQITPAHLIDPAQPGSSFRGLANIENAIEDGIWCARFAEDVPTDPDDIEVVAEDEASVTYKFKPAIGEDAEGPEKKIARRTEALLTVSKVDPAILSYARSLTRTVTVFVVAKIKKANTVVECERAPNGLTYTRQVISEFEASGFGDGGANTSDMRITALYDPSTGQRITPDS
ncbi:MAG: hypothetical protein AAFS13_04820 [Pseudomonadota bacterium]